MDGVDDRRMGCMGGFLQLFDRNHILAGKRLYSTKRLPHFTVPDDSSESNKFVASPAVSKELGKPQPSPDQSKKAAAAEVSPVEPPSLSVPVETPTPPKSPLPLPMFEVKEGTRSSWKFCKEAPRLSLDSRAVVDAKGTLRPRDLRTKASVLSANKGENTEDGDDNQRPCPSVIARLMGLEPLPQSSPETLPKVELRRSASESRVSRDLFNGRFVDGNHVDSKEINHPRSNISNTAMKDNAANERRSSMDRMGYPLKNEKIERPKASNRSLSSSPWKAPQLRKCFFDTADIFPEPKQTVSLYGEIDKRLKMRGIDEPSKDLETLKQILEALQLKGLLHNKRPLEQIGQRNFVYDPTFSSDESPIVLMRPSRSVSPSHRRMANGTPPSNVRSRNVIGRRPNNLSSESLPSVSPCRERPNARSPIRSRDSSSPTQRENSVRLSSSVAKPKNLNVENRRRAGEPIENRRVSPVQSPKLSSRRTSLEQNGAKGSPRNKRETMESKQKEKITTFVVEDESSSISESTVSSSFQTDAERSNLEEYNEGRSLLERCDKLLNSIAEMTAPESQPSPVSVLDSSFYRDDSPSPSPIMKRNIDFKAESDVSGESEEELWLSAFSPIRSKYNDSTDDSHLGYISDILRASCYLPEDSDVFLLLEKQQYLKGKDTSKVFRLERKLIFDTITEILDRNKQLPPWKVFAKPSAENIWTEFQRIQGRESGNNLVEIICEVLKKDLTQDTVNGWGDCPVEMSEAVLDMERQIFKDLIVETIQDLAVIGCKTTHLTAPCRKLVF
ncbi:protein LONGIFOLIA 1 isoform X1 [Lycium barbarum]|uniref:protein LONGIFOLIA 1 isoform X1 n=1 Tax=Lycium barbarum TaxID=112863 RepID=UPI00293F37D0|nr:protein LONGIFOLIA 1 isoform X1 [Lycium barbarum]XP_060172156.1 protein LONGIFOLIA 1 isoform X1 [Lycium barbarum]XP_060172157.1 protein LONGIFOLIA 1 isoform X1 [Lycium barbarum]